MAVGKFPICLKKHGLARSYSAIALDGGVTVLAADGGSGERWIAGGRGLHISCWPRGQKAVIPGMRTMMATLRWADEPATDGERWWRKE